MHHQQKQIKVVSKRSCSNSLLPKTYNVPAISPNFTVWQWYVAKVTTS